MLRETVASGVRAALAAAQAASLCILPHGKADPDTEFVLQLQRVRSLLRRDGVKEEEQGASLVTLTCSELLAGTAQHKKPAALWPRAACASGSSLAAFTQCSHRQPHHPCAVPGRVVWE